MTDATEKLVDDILRIGADRADPAPEPVKAARIYHKTCVLCGADFAAKSPAALYCPDCVQKRRIDGGRKSAQKAHGLKEKGEERIAAAPAGPRNDEAANAISPRHSEEADKADVGIRKTPPVTREALLDMAKAVVCGEREKQHGSPEDSFRAIADYWTVYLRQTGNLPEHRELTSEDAAIMMILLKVARQAGRGKLDNWVDIAGYAACGAEIAEG